MNKKILIWMIAAILVFFVLIKVLVYQFCHPERTNQISHLVSDTLSLSSSQASSNREPLSWEPLLHQLAIFFSKACAR